MNAGNRTTLFYSLVFIKIQNDMIDLLIRQYRSISSEFKTFLTYIFTANYLKL